MSKNLNNPTEIIKETIDNDWGLFIDIELQVEQKKHKYNRIKSSHHVSVPSTIIEHSDTRVKHNESLMFKMDEDYENEDNNNYKDDNDKDDNHKTNKVNTVCFYTNTCGAIAFVLLCIIIL